MKYCRFQLDRTAHYGLVESVAGHDEITRLLLQAPQTSEGDVEGLPSRRMDRIPLEQASLLAPVRPSKIVCVGRNYREHVAELGNEIPAEPLLFFKPPSSLQRPGGVVVLPAASNRVDFEGELALVIGRRTRNLKPEDNWRETLRGFTLANDISARDLQRKDVQWARAKGFDTFCPVGPVVSDELDLDAGVTLETRVNGELRQQASTNDLIFSVPILLCHISAAFTLEPGDLILTGTPSGVGPLKPGDRVEVSVAGLGVLANTVEAETV